MNCGEIFSSKYAIFKDITGIQKLVCGEDLCSSNVMNEVQDMLSVVISVNVNPSATEKLLKNYRIGGTHLLLLNKIVQNEALGEYNFSKCVARF